MEEARPPQCPHCGTTLGPDDLKCSKCGATLEDEVPPFPPGVPPIGMVPGGGFFLHLPPLPTDGPFRTMLENFPKAISDALRPAPPTLIPYDISQIRVVKLPKENKHVTLDPGERVLGVDEERIIIVKLQTDEERFAGMEKQLKVLKQRLKEIESVEREGDEDE